MRLLGRDRSDASFTFEGQLLMPYIRAVINQQHILQEQVSRIHGLEEGLIRLGTFGSVSAHWLPGLLKTFLNTHPKIKFELIHGTNQESESRVRDGSLDLAFVLMLAASDLSFISLFHDPIVAVVLQSSTLALAEKLPLKMLENAPYIKLSEQV